MKKIITVLLVFNLMIVLIPLLINGNLLDNMDKELKKKSSINNDDNKKNIEDNNIKDDINNKENKDYEYSQYNTIKVLHKNENTIEEIKLDEYLLGVVSAEMPASFHEEALKAQAVVARTYTIYSIIHNKNKHEGADICDDSKCCQAWISKESRFEKWKEEERESNWKKIEEAVNSTKGKVITYNGEVIDAFFHSNSGGKTEKPVNVWGGTNYPYLQAVQTSGEDAYSQYSSEVILSKEEFVNKIKEKHKNFEIDFNKENCIKIEELTESDRIKTIRIGNITMSGVELRTIIGLKSANFKIEINEDNIKFNVIGYGHGVGMSQTGADSLAKQGMKYEEIIKHFYTGVEIIYY